MARSLAEVGRVRMSALEMVDRNTRIEMIGSNLKLHGDRWARRHQQHVAWLDTIGVTRQDAIDRHNEWLSKTMSDPFWSTNRGS